jgi:amino acid adenylation domain-containing protein
MASYRESIFVNPLYASGNRCKALLLRYTGQEDIIVASLSSDGTWRRAGERQERVANPVALRTNLAGDPDGLGLLRRVAKTVGDAAANQDYPFERVVERVQSDQDFSRSPIFQAMFVLCNAPSCLSVAAFAEKDLAGVEEYIARCDVAVVVAVAEEAFRVRCQYDAELFAPTTIVCLLRHFQTLLEGITATPEQRLSALPLLTEAERQQLLGEWNQTQVPYPRDVCLHQLFEVQAEQTPEAVAVVFEAQEVTYRELNARANQLARYLQKRGVGPETLVGICVERSVEMIIGVLGILKAGGIYVPLDPMYPRERLSFMLEDARVPLLVTQQRLLDRLPAQGVELVCLDTAWQSIAHESRENVTSSVTASNLAYVIYTSGSTGRPKGVCIPHRGVVRLVKGTTYVNLTAEEVFLQLAPLSFDASTFEIWGCLLNGARLVIFPPYTPSLAELGQALQQYHITTLWLTAGLFHAMVEGQLESLRQVRQLLAGGDVLSVSHVKEALRQVGEGRLINGYGPTESTTFACCYEMTEPNQPGPRVPVGRPIANTQVYVLDRSGQPVPVGVPGELHIGGDGLARDYLNHPQLTSEKFIPHPFSNEAGARLYKTGDLVRYRPDGNLEFLGRLDHQVKVHGFRIELGEVEAALDHHPAIRQSVVIAREDPSGDKRLIAYVVSTLGAAPPVGELRSFLKSKLPEYMMPSTFVMLDRLPLTPNGKVDRRALPTPEWDRPELAEGFAAPRTPVEEVMAGIWTKVLGLERVGIHDNFFELGGHSLSATQVISRVRAAFQVEVSLREFFARPTIAECAVLILQTSLRKQSRKS